MHGSRRQAAACLSHLPSATNRLTKTIARVHKANHSHIANNLTHNRFRHNFSSADN
jgi:uncharacterized protein (DUF2336 family)